MKPAGLPQIRSLSTQQKLLLVDELWRDGAPDPERMEVGEAEKGLLDHPWSADLEDPASRPDLEGFKRRLRALRG